MFWKHYRWARRRLGVIRSLQYAYNFSHQKCRGYK